jgi:uncharacterized protein YeaC (DUF1315 family)
MSRSIRSSKTLSEIQRSEFLQQINAFAPQAYQRYQHSQDVGSWARGEARFFHHEVNPNVPFALTYSVLVKYHADMRDGHTQVSESTRSQRATQQAAQATQTTQAAQATVTELAAGQKSLNRLFHYEYNRWWDAFEIEAAEAEGTTDEMSATDRFSLHCARILRTKTGLPVDQITPVVEAWLIEKGQAE